MPSKHASLDAATTERKARLATLKSLKRKQPEPDVEAGVQAETRIEAASSTVTTTYLSGRNYDAATRGPKLGFENNPAENQETLEKRARELAIETSERAAEEEKADKPIDLFKLQPKKPNWDLKRDVQKRMERLNVQTENAIARMVRERIAAQKEAQLENEGKSGAGKDVSSGEVVGMAGEELVTALHQREREEEEDERRDMEEDEEEEVI